MCKIQPITTKCGPGNNRWIEVTFCENGPIEYKPGEIITFGTHISIHNGITKYKSRKLGELRSQCEAIVKSKRIARDCPYARTQNSQPTVLKLLRTNQIVQDLVLAKI